MHMNKYTNGNNKLDKSYFISKIKEMDYKLHNRYENSNSLTAQLFKQSDARVHKKYPYLNSSDVDAPIATEDKIYENV